MKVFDIYENALGRRYAVKMGWSWPGFLFGWPWALFKKMWGVWAITFFGTGVINCIVRNPMTYLILSIVVMILFGKFGNRWRRGSLLRKGFEHKDTIKAPSRDVALALYNKTVVAQTSSMSKGV